MSVGKEVPFRFPHPGPKERSNQFPWSRGRGKARARGPVSKAHQVHRRPPPEPSCKKAQVREKEKARRPWKGLIVIGKRVELLDRNLQKPKLWDPKLESEDWKPEGVGKGASKERSSPHQERTVLAPASFQDDSPEIGRQQDRLKDVSESSVMTAEAEERLKSKSKDKLRTTGGDLRSRGDQMRHSEELESSGETLMYKREKRASAGEEVVAKGAKRRSVVEKMDSRERRASVVEKTDSRERRRSTREKVSDSGERRPSVKEKVSDSGERRRSIKEKVSDSGERRPSVKEKVSDSGERRRSIKEKVSDSGERRRSSRVRSSDEKLKLSREKLRSSGEKLRAGGKNLRSSGGSLKTDIEETEFDEMKLKELSGTGSATEENIEKVINVTGDEGVMENMNQEMQVSDENMEGRDEQQRAEKEVEIDRSVLNEMEGAAAEFVPEEEKDTAGEHSVESGG